MCDFKFKDFAHHTFDLLDAGITKFQDLTTVNTDEVIVLLIAVGFFVLGQVLSKLMFFDQITIDQ